MSKEDLNKDDVTPLALYLNRRNFLKTSIYTATGLATYSTYKFFRGGEIETLQPTLSTPDDSLVTAPTPAAAIATPNEIKQQADIGPSTPYKHITNYNNFYEFSTDKQAVAAAAANWKFSDWNLEISGLVEKPMKLNLKELLAIKAEERIYRFRCVEGWSMVIPWMGFPLSTLLEKCKPLSNAKYVAFESYYDEKEMPDARASGLPFPYIEGLRLDEAMHPLTIMATGLYGQQLPNQNGAAIRLVVPWKYGFKSIKSVVKIRLTDQQPATTWNLASPNEYGFYSNVNPMVDHPRWSQAQERRIGDFGVRETLMFNGYEDQVAKLYAGLDLRENF